jgi:hypothetical protein
VPGSGSKAAMPAGQSPIFAGSFPILTNCPIEGVGPSSTKIINHPGGATCASGGVVIVHVSPSQVKAGKIVLWPMALPCVLTTDPSIETRRFAVEPEVRVN